MLRLLLLVAALGATGACGSAVAPASDAMLERLGAGGAARDEAPDAMLETLVAGGAARAAVCTRGAGGAGCAGAVWARHWLLARASCLERARLHRAPVLMYRGPEDCRLFNGTDAVLELHALMSFVHPGYSPPASDSWEPERRESLDPLDAALVVLSAAAPPTRADNHSSTILLLPQLSSWLRYIPAQVSFTYGRRPARRAALFESPLRMLLTTVLAPFAGLLLAFVLLLRWPEAEPEEKLTERVGLCDEPDDVEA